jgi:hypothetical protein
MRHPALYEKYTGERSAAFLSLRNAYPCERNSPAPLKFRRSGTRPKQKNKAPALYEKYTGVRIAAFLLLRNAYPCERNSAEPLKFRRSGARSKQKKEAARAV